MFTEYLNQTSEKPTAKEIFNVKIGDIKPNSLRNVSENVFVSSTQWASYMQKNKAVETSIDETQLENIQSENSSQDIIKTEPAIEEEKVGGEENALKSSTDSKKEDKVEKLVKAGLKFIKFLIKFYVK